MSGERERLVALLLTSGALAACASNGGRASSPSNIVSAALTAAATDKFQSERDDTHETMGSGWSRYSHRGLPNGIRPFRVCRILFSPAQRVLYCERFGNRSIEPEFTQLASFIASSVPKSYHEVTCKLEKTALAARCLRWRLAGNSWPEATFWASKGDSGNYVYIFQVLPQPDVKPTSNLSRP
jgi:hypothetical protein